MTEQRHLVNSESVKIEKRILDRCRALASKDQRTLATTMRILLTEALEKRKA